MKAGTILSHTSTLFFSFSNLRIANLKRQDRMALKAHGSNVLVKDRLTDPNALPL